MTRTSNKSEEHKQKLRDAARRRYADPTERQKQSERMAEVYRSNPDLQKMNRNDASQKRSNTLRDKWQTPEYREQILASRNTSEVKQKLRDAAVHQWAQHRDTLTTAIRSARHANIDPRFHDPEWIRSANEQYTLTELAAIVGCSQSCMSRQFATFGIIPKQHPVAYVGGELQVMSFVQSLGVSDVVHRDRNILSPLELDLYIPSARVGIEYHGCFWHSYDRLETADERRRHQRKYLASRAANIRLLQFWDCEWTQHPSVCRSIISGLLGYNQSIGARICTVHTPDPHEVSAFLNDHHIQGACPYTHGRGLYWEGQLVMVMTIGKSRFKRGVWELLRLSTKSGLHISGGASKLWAALRPLVPSGCEVHSYADARLFQGAVYPTLGFTWSHDTPPGYQYWQNGQLYSRLAFQKHKISVRPGYDASRTEAENMFQWGYRRIWDAGQSVWIYRP